MEIPKGMAGSRSIGCALCTLVLGICCEYLLHLEKKKTKRTKLSRYIDMSVRAEAEEKGFQTERAQFG